MTDEKENLSLKIIPRSKKMEIIISQPSDVIKRIKEFLEES